MNGKLNGVPSQEDLDKLEKDDDCICVQSLYGSIKRYYFKNGDYAFQVNNPDGTKFTTGRKGEEAFEEALKKHYNNGLS